MIAARESPRTAARPPEHGKGPGAGRAWALAAVLAAACIGRVAPASAGCNIIPGTSKTFRGTLGALDRPFAAPGQFVEVALAGGCDGQRRFAPERPADHVVTVTFRPPNGAPHLVVLAADCNGLNVADACRAQLTCVAAVMPGDLQVVNDRRLRFRFPDTDALVGTEEDDLTLTGPAAVAVLTAGTPVPCQLAGAPCTPDPGLLACVDTLFAADGTCGTVADETFPQFTVLPPPNDAQAVCSAPAPPCTGRAAEVRFAVDSAGNALLPMDWRGVLVGQGVPIARLLHGMTAVHAFGDQAGAVHVPARAFLGSYSPEGAKLPPLFDPQFDPDETSELVLFGSVDAPDTVLRIARISPTSRACHGGANDAQPCRDAAECPDGACDPAQSLFEFRDRMFAGIGPVRVPATLYSLTLQDPVPLEGLIETPALFAFVVPEPIERRGLNQDQDLNDDVVVLTDRRTGIVAPIAHGAASRRCVGGAAAGQSCTDSSGCPGGSCPVGRAATRIRQPPFTFPAVAAQGGVVAFLEGEPHEGDCAVKACDQNGDGDVLDTILRVVELRDGVAEEHTAGLTLAVDAAPLLNGQSVVVSDQRVFFRSAEAAQARQQLQRVSVASDGTQSDEFSYRGSPSVDGRFTAFTSAASNLVPGDTNAFCDTDFDGDIENCDDVFVRDEAAGTTVRVSVDSHGGEADSGSYFPSISPDGRLVSFGSTASNLVEGDTRNRCDVNFDGVANENCPDFFVHDRDADGNGIFDEAGGVTTTRISVGANGAPADTRIVLQELLASSPSADGHHVAFVTDATNLVPGDTNGQPDIFARDLRTATTVRVSVASEGSEADGGSFEPSISADGRFVAFSSIAANLVPGDTNGAFDVFVHDRDTDGDGRFDEPGAVATRRVSVGVDGEQARGLSARVALSPDGRYVSFHSDAANLVAGDTNNRFDVFVHDRDADSNGVFDEPGGTSATRVSLSAAAQQGNFSSFAPFALSQGGRYVAFSSTATNLVPNDANQARDVFVHDRLTGLTSPASVAVSGAMGNAHSSEPAVSADGTHVVFNSDADDLVAGDTNEHGDVFSRGPDPLDVASDLSGDQDLGDTVLRVLDLRSRPAVLSTIGPAEQVAVAGARAAYLALEAAFAAAGTDLNGDGDALDRVVHLYRGAGTAENLRRAATAVALSEEWLAALVSESAQGAGPLNGDGDTADAVVQAYPASGDTGAWTNTGQAGEAVRIAASVVGFLTPEREQGQDFNGDGDRGDRVVQLYYPATAQRVLVALNGVPPAAEDFVFGQPAVCLAGERRGERCGGAADCLGATCAPELLALRAREAADGGRDLNGDGDAGDDVLMVYDLVAGTLINTRETVTPCRLEACDPRVPYRVMRDTVKFLTRECDHGGGVTAGCPGGGTDLNGDGDAGDLLLETFNVRLFAARPADPRACVAVAATPAGVCADTGTACTTAADCPNRVCFVPPGGCIVDRGVCCNPSPESAENPCGGETGTCAPGQFCRPSAGAPGIGTCHDVLGTCTSDGDCTVRNAAAVCSDAGQSFQRLIGPLHAGGNGEQIFVGAGRCVEDLGVACGQPCVSEDVAACAAGLGCAPASDGSYACQCPSGQSCRSGAGAGSPTCHREHGSCTRDDQCPTGPAFRCQTDLLVATAADSDGDEVADPFDNCPSIPNVTQDDRNGDGVGDACALEVSPSPTPTAPATPTATAAATSTSTAGACCTANGGRSCGDGACAACVCAIDSFCCDDLWDGRCVEIAAGRCNPSCRCAPSCAGDCSGDGVITVDELVRGVNIALGNLPLDRCADFDPNGDGQVAINELIQAVRFALEGCPAS